MEAATCQTQPALGLPTGLGGVAHNSGRCLFRQRTRATGSARAHAWPAPYLDRMRARQVQHAGARTKSGQLIRGEKVLKRAPPACRPGAACHTLPRSGDEHTQRRQGHRAGSWSSSASTDSSELRRCRGSSWYDSKHVQPHLGQHTVSARTQRMPMGINVLLGSICFTD
jgi:hypothetical protein